MKPQQFKISRPELSVIMPVFNEQKTVADAVLRVIQRNILPVVVDDCSTDGSREILEKSKIID
jgi:glycosyltransferase involved in cell wall biosynthesis